MVRVDESHSWPNWLISVMLMLMLPVALQTLKHYDQNFREDKDKHETH